MEIVRNAIIQRKEKILEAISSGNANGIAICYYKEAELFPPNGDVVRGIEEIEYFWRRAMEKGLKKAELETINIESSGSTALEVGDYTFYLVNGQVTDFGEYIAIWRNKDDVWKLFFHQWNSNKSADINENLNIHINKAIKDECEMSGIGCSYINFNTIKCNKCIY